MDLGEGRCRLMGLGVLEELRASRLKRLVGIAGALVLAWLLIQPLGGNVSFAFYLMFWVGLALAINMVFGYTGYIPFGFFAFYGIGAYGAAMAYLHLGIPMVVALFVGAGASVLLGIVFLPMFRLEGIYFAIANFAAAFAIRIGMTLTPEWLTGGASGIVMAEVYDPMLTYYAMVVVTLAAVAVTLWLDRSKFGLVLKAVRDDEVAAGMSGINQSRVRSYAWLLSVAFAGMYGGLDAWNTTVLDPATMFDVTITVKSLLYVIFGGPATVIGPIIGGTTLYMIDSFIWRLLPLGSMLITGLVLMLVVLVLPRGLVNEFDHYWTRLKTMLQTRQIPMLNTQEDE
jgi:branched-chain amino acid transport system permease protein